MDTAQEVLYGRFPRFVGNPHQWPVHSKPEMESFLEHNNGVNNVYSSISHYTSDGIPISDKVSIDLDSNGKETMFPETNHEDIKIDIMREEPERAEDVLGEVLEDAKKIARWSREQHQPLVSVFSGFGIHLHLLYQPVADAVDELTSTAELLKEELDLSTIDRVPIGDANRLMRMPNCHRIYEGRSCQLYTVPLTAEDILELDVHELLEISQEPRDIEAPEYDRPEMEVHEEYLGRGGSESVEGREPVQDPGNLENDFVKEHVIDEIIEMPCIRERIVQPDPSHHIRMQAAIHLFNNGAQPQEVFEYFKQLNWVDWDAAETKKQLKQLYKRGYADMSCQTLQENGLCIYPYESRDEECETYGYSGGKMEYK